MDTWFADHASSNDVRTLPLLATDLCKLMLDSLDDQQRQAVVAARRTLSSEGADDVWVVEFAKRIDDADQERRVVNIQAARNRLVWTALNANTKWSAFAGEFLIGLGSDAGLTVSQMAPVFLDCMLSKARD